jgi:hypothetical protein
LLIKFTNTTVTSVIDEDSFATFRITNAGGKGFVRFDGGNIPKNTDRSVIIETGAATGSKFDLIKESFVDGTERGKSAKDDIFSKAIPGGPSGTDFAGVNIPANQFGYFYQFDRNSLFPQSPDRFEIVIGDQSPTSLGFLSNTWLVSQLIDDLPEDVSSDTI